MNLIPEAIKFGVHTFIWKKEFEGQEAFIFEQAKSWGFSGVEISTHLFEQIDPAIIHDYRNRYGLDITLCTSMLQGLSLTTNDQQIRDQAIAYIQKAIAFCEACGITKLSGPLIHPVGYLSGLPLQEFEKIFLLDTLKVVAEFLSRTEIKLALEPLNRFQGYALNTVEQGLELLEAVGSPQVGLLLDLFHMNIEEKDILGAFRLAGDRCFHIHACACDRGTPGTDSFPWQKWFEVLRDLNYQNWIVIESFNFADPELATMARVWRSLAPSSEYIAREGLKFLTQTYNSL
jgi:D-psicose/D-tagatose/L-ribulose 3-epimerase